MMRLLPFVLEQVDVPTILAGHGYDVGTEPRGDGGGGDDEGGLTTFWILAVGGLALATAGILVALDPAGAAAKLRRHGAKVLILAVVAAPLVAWTAASGSEEKGLLVERWTTEGGAPELIFSLRGEELNTPETTGGQNLVRLECVDGDGEVVLAGKKRWPFPTERGFDYPHVHQAATTDQVLAVDTCRLLETTVTLEADVQGTLEE